MLETLALRTKCLLAFLSILSLAAFFQNAPDAENPAVLKFRELEAKELEQASGEMAKKHFKLGEWCAKEGLQRRARLHFLRAVSLDEKNSAYKKALDAVKVGEDELVAAPNRKDEQSQTWKNYATQLESLTRVRAMLDLKLADKAKAAGLASEEARILRRITYYSSNNADARRRLSDVKAERAKVAGKLGGGFSWREASSEHAVHDVRVEGPLEPTDEEKKIPFPLHIFQTDHFRVLTELPDDFAKHYAQTAEEGYRFINSVGPGLLPEGKNPGRLRCVLALGEENYKKALEAVGILSAEDLPVYKSRGTCRRGSWFLTSQRDQQGLRTDRYLHNGAEWAMDVDQPWLREGLAYLATRELNESSNSSCFPAEKGSSVKAEEHWRQEDAWRDLLVESVLLREDPPAKQVCEAELKKLRGAAGVKGWSLVEFLFRKDPQRFAKFLKDTRNSRDPWAALTTHYHFTPDVLDIEWRSWVLLSY